MLETERAAFSAERASLQKKQAELDSAVKMLDSRLRDAFRSSENAIRDTVAASILQVEELDRDASIHVESGDGSPGDRKLVQRLQAELATSLQRYKSLESLTAKQVKSAEERVRGDMERLATEFVSVRDELATEKERAKSAEHLYRESEAQAHALRKQITTLDNELRETIQHRDNMAAELAKVKGAAVKGTHDVEAAMERVALSMGEVRAAEKRAAEAEAAREAQARAFEAERLEVKEKAEEMRRHLADLSAAVIENKRECKAAQAEADRAKTALAEAQARLERGRVEDASHHAEVETLKAQNSVLAADLSLANDRVANLQRSQQDLIEQLREAERRSSPVRASDRSSSPSLGKLEMQAAEVADLRRSVANLTESVARHAAAHESTRHDLETSRDQVRTLKAQLQHLAVPSPSLSRVQVDQVAAQLSSEQAARRAAEARAEQLDDLLKEATINLRTLTIRCKAMEKELQEGGAGQHGAHGGGNMMNTSTSSSSGVATATSRSGTPTPVTVNQAAAAANSVAALRERIAHLEAGLAESNRRVLAEQRRVGEAELAAGLVRDEKRSLEVRAAAAVAERDAAVADVETKLAEVEQIKAELAAQREATEVADRARAGLEEDLRHERERVFLIHSSLEEQTKEAVRGLYGIEAHHENVVLKERVKALEREVASLVHLPRELGVRQAEQQAEHAKARDRIKSLERALAQSERPESVRVETEVAKLEAELNAQRDKYHQLHLKFFEASDELNLSLRNVRLLEQDLEQAEKAQNELYVFLQAEGKRLAQQGSAVLAEQIAAVHERNRSLAGEKTHLETRARLLADDRGRLENDLALAQSLAKQQAARREAEIVRLGASLEEAERELSKARTAAQEAAARAAEAEAEVRALRLEASRGEGDAATRVADLETLVARHAEAERALRSKVDRLETAARVHEERAAVTEAQRAEQVRAADEGRLKLKEVSDKLREALNELGLRRSHDAELKQAHERIRQLETELTSLTAKFRDASLTQFEIGDNLGKEQGRVRALEAELLRLQGLVEQLQARIAERDRKVVALEADHAAEVARLLAGLSRAQGDHEAAERRCKDALADRDRVAELAEAEGRRVRELAAEAEQARQREATVSEAAEQLQRALREVRDLREAHRETSDRCVGLEEQARAARRAEQEAHEAAQQWRRKHDALNSKVADGEVERARLQRRLEAQAKAVEEQITHAREEVMGSDAKLFQALHRSKEAEERLKLQEKVVADREEKIKARELSIRDREDEAQRQVREARERQAVAESENKALQMTCDNLTRSLTALRSGTASLNSSGIGRPPQSSSNANGSFAARGQHSNQYGSAHSVERFLEAIARWRNEIRALDGSTIRKDLQIAPPQSLNWKERLTGGSLDLGQVLSIQHRFFESPSEVRGAMSDLLERNRKLEGVLRSIANASQSMADPVWEGLEDGEREVALQLAKHLLLVGELLMEANYDLVFELNVRCYFNTQLKG